MLLSSTKRGTCKSCARALTNLSRYSSVPEVKKTASTFGNKAKTIINF